MNSTNDHNTQRSQAGAPLPRIDPHLAAVWGAFLHEGLMLNSRNTERTIKLLDLWGNGCIELVQSVCEYIPILWHQVQPHWDRPQGFPGVFEYEVVSILGEQIAEYMLTHDGSLPNDRQFQMIASELVTKFFAQGEPSAAEEAALKPSQASGKSFMWSMLRTLLGGDR